MLNIVKLYLHCFHEWFGIQNWLLGNRQYQNGYRLISKDWRKSQATTCPAWSCMILHDPAQGFLLFLVQENDQLGISVGTLYWLYSTPNDLHTSTDSPVEEWDLGHPIWNISRGFHQRPIKKWPQPLGGLRRSLGRPDSWAMGSSLEMRSV